jgi:hypothetical protein
MILMSPIMLLPMPTHVQLGTAPELVALSDDSLTFADKERKGQVIKLIDYLASVKVIDAPILLKLYDLYRYKL